MQFLLTDGLLFRDGRSGGLATGNWKWLFCLKLESNLVLEQQSSLSLHFLPRLFPMIFDFPTIFDSAEVQSFSFFRRVVAVVGEPCCLLQRGSVFEQSRNFPRLASSFARIAVVAARSARRCLCPPTPRTDDSCWTSCSLPARPPYLQNPFLPPWPQLCKIFAFSRRFWDPRCHRSPLGVQAALSWVALHQDNIKYWNRIFNNLPSLGVLFFSGMHCWWWSLKNWTTKAASSGASSFPCWMSPTTWMSLVSSVPNQNN